MPKHQNSVVTATRLVGNAAGNSLSRSSVSFGTRSTNGDDKLGGRSGWVRDGRREAEPLSPSSGLTQRSSSPLFSKRVVPVFRLQTYI